MDKQSLDGSWTLPSSAEVESYVHLENYEAAAVKVLNLSVTPLYETIGFFSNERTTKICINITACDIPDYDDEARSPVDIIVSLDTSDSMSGNKIKDCKRTLEVMLRHLSSKDRFGLVSYGSVAKVEFPACFMTPDNKEKALKRIKSIDTNGCTNLSGGLSLAAQEMKLIEKPNTIRSIFLLTDGHANVGITYTDQLVQMVKGVNELPPVPDDEMKRLDLDADDSKMEASETVKPASADVDKPKDIIVHKNTPISILCFGYGTDHNSKMLKSIAEASFGGAYYFVEHDANVYEAFGDAMGGILSVVAQSAVLVLSVPEESVGKGVKIINVYHDEKVARENGSFTVHVGDFYSEESRDVLLEVQLNSDSPNDETPVTHLEACLSFMDTVHNRSTQEGPIQALIDRPSNFLISGPQLLVEEQWLRIRTVQEMEKADEEANSNNLEAARARLRAMVTTLTESASYLVHKSPMVTTLVNDVNSLISRFQSREHYRHHGSHQMKNIVMAQKRQRCCGESTQAGAFYSNKKKAAMARSFAKSKK